MNFWKWFIKRHDFEGRLVDSLLLCFIIITSLCIASGFMVYGMIEHNAGLFAVGFFSIPVTMFAGWLVVEYLRYLAEMEEDG